MLSQSDFRDVFEEDLEDTFLEMEEYAEAREFVTRGSNNTRIVSNKKVIWNHDSLRNLPAVVTYGQLMVGDVLVLTRVKDWPSRPLRGQMIWSPRDTAWTVIFCQMILHRAYRIGLQQAEPTM